MKLIAMILLAGTLFGQSRIPASSRLPANSRIPVGAAPAGGVAYVSTVACNNAGGSSITTFPCNNTVTISSGQTIAVFGGWGTGTITSVTDGTNTYTSTPSCFNGVGATGQWFYSLHPTAGTYTVTLNAAGGATYLGPMITLLSGATALDVSSSCGATFSPTPATTIYTTAYAPEVILVGLEVTASVTVSAAAPFSADALAPNAPNIGVGQIGSAAW